MKQHTHQFKCVTSKDYVEQCDCHCHKEWHALWCGVSDVCKIRSCSHCSKEKEQHCGCVCHLGAYGTINHPPHCQPEPKEQYDQLKPKRNKGESYTDYIDRIQGRTEPKELSCGCPRYDENSMCINQSHLKPQEESLGCDKDFFDWCNKELNLEMTVWQYQGLKQFIREQILKERNRLIGEIEYKLPYFCNDKSHYQELEHFFGELKLKENKDK